MANKKTTKAAKSVKTNTKFPTLLEAIERVVELSKDSKMSDDLLLAASPEIGLLADSYGITEQQAVLFCICMEREPRGQYPPFQDGYALCHLLLGQGAHQPQDGGGD